MTRPRLFTTRIAGPTKRALQGRPIAPGCLPVLFFFLLGLSFSPAGQVQSAPSVVVFGAREDAAPFSSSSDGITFVGYTIDLCNQIFERYRIFCHPIRP